MLVTRVIHAASVALVTLVRLSPTELTRPTNSTGVRSRNNAIYPILCILILFPGQMTTPRRQPEVSRMPDLAMRIS